MTLIIKLKPRTEKNLIYVQALWAELTCKDRRLTRKFNLLLQNMLLHHCLVRLEERYLIEEAKDDLERKRKRLQRRNQVWLEGKGHNNFFVIWLLLIFPVKICIPYCIPIFYYDVIKLCACFILSGIDHALYKTKSGGQMQVISLW